MNVFYCPLVAWMVNNQPSNAGDPASGPEFGRSPAEGNCNPPQCSCLGNPMDREAWWATVHGVSQLDMTERLTLFIIHGSDSMLTLVAMHNYKVTKNDIDVYKIFYFGRVSFYNMVTNALLTSSAFTPVSPVKLIFPWNCIVPHRIHTCYCLFQEYSFHFPSLDASYSHYRTNVALVYVKNYTSSDINIW